MVYASCGVEKSCASRSRSLSRAGPSRSHEHDGPYVPFVVRSDGDERVFSVGLSHLGALTFPQQLASLSIRLSRSISAPVRKKESARTSGRVFSRRRLRAALRRAAPLVGPFFRALGTPRGVSLLEQKYWFYFCLGAVPAIAHEPLGSFFTGQRKMKVVMTLGIATVLIERNPRSYSNLRDRRILPGPCRRGYCGSVL